MPSYRVNVLGVQGINNIVFKANEIVSEEDFNTDQFNEYLNDKKIVEVEKKIEKVEKKVKQVKTEEDV